MGFFAFQNPHFQKYPLTEVLQANRYAGLDAKNDPLVKIDEVVPWEDFRPRLDAAWRKPAEDRKSQSAKFCSISSGAALKWVRNWRWDALVMFKAIVLCALYNLSDDQVEYQLRDRLSFMRFGSAEIIRGSNSFRWRTPGWPAPTFDNSLVVQRLS